MNKDAILASVIGFGIGLFITGAILVGPNLFSQIKNWKETVKFGNPKPQQKAIPTQATVLADTGLTIESPTQDSIVNKDSIAVNGKAQEGSIVVVGGLLDETVTEATGGAYSAKISLKEGRNEISVSVLGEKPATTKVTVYMTP